MTLLIISSENERNFSKLLILKIIFDQPRKRSLHYFYREIYFYRNNFHKNYCYMKKLSRIVQTKIGGKY